MAALHHPHHQRSLVEIELDAAVRSAGRRCDVLEDRLADLGKQITAVRNEASAAGIFDERIPVQPSPPETRPARRRVAARTALARAALR